MANAAVDWRGRHGPEGEAVNVLGNRTGLRYALAGATPPATEYGVTKMQLQLGWAARPLKFVQDEGRPCLLLEDPGGEFLRRAPRPADGRGLPEPERWDGQGCLRPARTGDP